MDDNQVEKKKEGSQIRVVRAQVNIVAYMNAVDTRRNISEKRSSWLTEQNS